MFVISMAIDLGESLSSDLVGNVIVYIKAEDSG